jgi:multidrug efflux pump subunit AcrB
VQDGGVTITAEFRLEKPVQEAVDDVRSAVSRVRSELPGDLRDPIVTKLDWPAQPVLAFTVAAHQRACRWTTKPCRGLSTTTMSKRLLAVRGVGAVNRVGGVTREVRVALDPLRLQALGVTAPKCRASCARCRLKAPAAGPTWAAASNPCARWPPCTTAQQLAGSEIALSDGRRVRLDQHRQRERHHGRTAFAAALLNGKPVVGFEVSRSKGAERSDRGRGRASRAARTAAAHPDLESPSPSTS